MPLSVMIPIATLSASIGVLGLVLVIGKDRARQVVITNLQRGLLLTDVEADNHQASQARAKGLAALALRLTPRSALQRLDRFLARAGRPAAWPIERVVLAKPVLGIMLALIGLLLVSAAPKPILVVLAAVITIGGYFIPDLLLYSRGQERSQQITLELADTLDQMTIAVEAGLGFDAAMARAGKNGRGPLAEELVRTLQDIQMGQSRRQAYDALAIRTDSVDLRRFIRSIIQADAYGISISDVLRTQAQEMRLKRRQRAEEKAMQIPVKVIFPLMFCILPVLFIVLLGPVALSVMRVWH